MTEQPLLITKLQFPVLRQHRVARRHLLARLQAITTHKITVVTAPAGFGKTTLVREWVEQAKVPVVWLSLDRYDNHLARFLFYLVHACAQDEAETGPSFQIIHSPHSRTILTSLLNLLAARSHPQIIILDDYHVLTDESIHEAMDFLIEQLPAHIHLVIISRNVPPQSLARVRSQAQLLELTAADLRFTVTEVEQFLRTVMGLDLTQADLAALEISTQGWIAGVQLVGLALQATGWDQGQVEPGDFLSQLGGMDRYIEDYLTEEVLRHQSTEVRLFLLQTSIVEQLSASLCDALMGWGDHFEDDFELGQSGSQPPQSSAAMLEFLAQNNLFIIPLDPHRQAYRYHPLFLDLLRNQLQRFAPEKLQSLHHCASLWYQEQNQLDSAIRHGLKAQDFARVADLLELAFQQRDWIHQDMPRLLVWYESLPEPVVQSRPNLRLAYAWLLFEMFTDRWDDIERQLRLVEQTIPWAEAQDSEQDIATMLPMVDLLRANQARQMKELPKVITLCEQVLERLPADERYVRSGTLAHLASAYEANGQLTSAIPLYEESLHLCQKAENIDGLLFAAARLIQTFKVSGHLRQAHQVFRQIQAYTEERTGPDMGAIYIHLAEIYYLQNQLGQTRHYLEQGLALCCPFEAWQKEVFAGTLLMAQLLTAEEKYEQASKLLEDTEAQMLDFSSAEYRRLVALKIRLQLAHGNLIDPLRRATRSDRLATIEHNEDDYDSDREFERLTLVRLLLAQAALQAQGQETPILSDTPLDTAIALLDRLIEPALSGGRTAIGIKTYLLRAIAYATQHHKTAGFPFLQDALRLVEQEKNIRLFADEGVMLYPLLLALFTKPQASISSDYIATILDAFPKMVRQLTDVRQKSADTLTRRELNTLRLLASARSIEEIAAEMTVSISTIRTYTKRIYSKLDVHSRAEAVYWARQIKLLE